MSTTRLERQVFELANSDTRPRPTTGGDAAVRRCAGGEELGMGASGIALEPQVILIPPCMFHR
jgi:hypothetical protein